MPLPWKSNFNLQSRWINKTGVTKYCHGNRFDVKSLYSFGEKGEIQFGKITGFILCFKAYNCVDIICELKS